MNGARVELTTDELIMINNALNEVTHGIDLFEFETRMGASRAEVESVLNEFNKVILTIEQIKE
jgi:hypothetical protein